MLLQKKSDTELFRVPPVGKYKFDDIPLDDPRVYNLFANGKTCGIFQLEKQLGQDWSKKAKPKNIEDLAALVSILRPGCLQSGIAESYVKRRNGDEEVVYLHPSLEPILKNTYGLMIFQEQILEIGIKIAGFNEADADFYLRKGIGKKIPEIIAQCKNLFIDGCKNKGIVSDEVARQLFADIEKFQRYGFNKSHAVSYAITAYFTAYQKVHFPTEFYCSWLTFSDWKPDPKEEIYNLVQDAKMNNITVLPPDIFNHNIDFEIVKDKTIIFGLGHIRGVGAKAIETIKKLNEEISRFSGFIKNSKKLKRNIAESLIKSGACDGYKLNRTYMLKCLHALMGRNEKDKLNRKPEVVNLTPNEIKYVFDNIDTKKIEECLEGIIKNEICIKKRIPTIESKIKYILEDSEDTNTQKSIWEKIYLGLNLTCSAADDYEKIEKDITNCRQIYLVKPKQKIVMHVVIDEIKLKKTGEKSKTPGREYCYLCISDNTGSADYVVCWPDIYEEIKNDIAEDMVVCIYARKDSWGGRDQLIVDHIKMIG